MSWGKFGMVQATEFADRVREMIRHETNLVDHRMTWFLTSQSILFAAIGVVWGNDKEFLVLIATIGAIVALSFHVSLRASIKAVHGLEKYWLDHCEQLKLDPISEPPVNGLCQDQIGCVERNLFPWRLLPWFLGLMWVLVGGSAVMN